MGTKVESKTYLPGYFTMADSSVNSNGNWLSYHEESKPSGHVSDSFTITTANASPDYDKEMLKRTMLVHEATFRKQVNFDDTTSFRIDLVYKFFCFFFLRFYTLVKILLFPLLSNICTGI